MSMLLPWVSAMRAKESLMILKVFRPRKSILSIPTLSTTEPSYWVTKRSEFLSDLTGMYCIKSSGAMIMPAAWIPVCRAEPSKISAKASTFPSGEVRSFFRSASSGTSAKAWDRVVPGFSGTSLAIWLDLSKGNPNTRATSRMADLAPMLPKVIICATWFLPYLLAT